VAEHGHKVAVTLVVGDNHGDKITRPVLWPRTSIVAAARPFFPIGRHTLLGDYEWIVDEYPVFRVAPAS
jgi:hypothetical protein